MMDKRKDTIEKGLHDAQEAAAARENAQADSQRIIDEARKQSEEIVRKAGLDAEALKQNYRDSVDEETERQRAEMQADMDQQKEQMLGNLRGQIIDLSVNGAKKLVDESFLMDESKQRQLLTDMFTGMKNGQTIDVSSMPDNLEKIDVTTAITLTDTEKALIQKNFSSKLRKLGEIHYHVDPEILGGIVIHGGDKLIDNSVSSQAEKLREALS